MEYYNKSWWQEFRNAEIQTILDLTAEKNSDYKFQRAKAFCADGSLSVNSEGDKAKDIFRDLIGYSLIAIGMLERRG